MCKFDCRHACNICLQVKDFVDTEEIHITGFLQDVFHIARVRMWKNELSQNVENIQTK